MAKQVIPFLTLSESSIAVHDKGHMLGHFALFEYSDSHFFEASEFEHDDVSIVYDYM